MQLRDARDFLLAHRDDYDTAYREFRWPALERFNWALDWFDASRAATTARRCGSSRRTAASAAARSPSSSARSNQVANWLREQGVARGDRVIVMLGNQVELWETMLAAMKLGAVIIPATPLLGPADLVDRVERGDARHVIVADGATPRKFDECPATTRGSRSATPRRRLAAATPTPTAPRDVRARRRDAGGRPAAALLHLGHDRASPSSSSTPTRRYPVGHLSTMYWIGLRPGDVHLNISSPGWAKHAWSNVFAPWNAEATVLVYNYARFDAAGAARPDGRAAASPRSARRRPSGGC